MSAAIPEFSVQIDGPSRAALERCLTDYGKNYQTKSPLSPAFLASRIYDFLCELWPQLIGDPALMRLMAEQGHRESAHFCAHVWKEAEISVLLCSNERMAQWNFRFRGQKKATDILSFPVAIPDIPNGGEGWKTVETEAKIAKISTISAGGDLLLSLPCWLENCREFNCAPETELQRLLLHGLLHLFGLEHKPWDSPSQPQSPMLQYQETFLGSQRRTILPR